MRTDCSLRIEDYRRALQKWLETPCISRVVLVENSGYDMAVFEELARKFPDKSVELLTFSCPEFPGSRGKGYGEAFCIEHALSKSRLLKESGTCLKASGRYYVRNVAALLSFMQKNREFEVMCNFQNNLTWADSRIFGASASFLSNYFLPLHDIIDDTNGVCLENALARAVHRLMSDGGRWAMLPNAPTIDGVQATNDRMYSLNPFRVGMRECLHRVRLALLARQ